MRSQSKASRSFAARDAAEPWFQAHGINGHSVTFSTYDDPRLVRNPGATAIVGTGQDTRGDPAGFVIEVLPGKGVVEAQLLVPHGIATWHRNASMEARMVGAPLIDVLVAKANIHRARSGPVNGRDVVNQQVVGESSQAPFGPTPRPTGGSVQRTRGSGDCERCGGPVLDGVCWSCGKKS